MSEMAKIFTGESCMSNIRIPLNVKLLGSYKGHVWSILGPYFGYLHNIFGSTCLKWINFSVENHACQIEEYSLMLTLGPNLGHVWAILEPCLDYFYNIVASRFLKWLKFSLTSHACQIEEYSLMLNYWGHIMAMFRPY